MTRYVIALTFYSYKLRRGAQTMLIGVDIPESDNELPYRIEEEPPEEGFAAGSYDEIQAKYVDVAVREVGWAPRDVYKYIDKPKSMFSFLRG